ncbi:hypothetical protein H4R33_006218 [Dimargaris cristalligena]|uniref:Mago nashi 2 n=1 Tax=Dimargaris cristalligena TaxID=215637 RepID=A0A4V1J4D5_9FUNG|nr:hypothetical protein H4R33_006218 [Dimargaris cristalligena]RKP35179.1 mago nashi 2 [Dimargaris cristalligena]|eukprot:RKP35179.1 mago nashi 2 [Dimargaris cristalligena]
MDIEEPFFLRYYTGHSGRFGHEFLEFEFHADGICRYANNSNYRNENMIRKQMKVTPAVISEVKRIIKDSEILQEDDEQWPQRNSDGKQELEIRLGDKHISFVTSKIASLAEVQRSEDPEGLRVFYYLVQDLKCLMLSLISSHFKIKPI